MLKQWIGKSAIALAMGLAAAASIAAPAQAADVELDLLVDDRRVGSLVHHDADDVFTLHDWYPDGHGVRGTIYMIDETGDRNRVDSFYNGKGTGEYVALTYNILSGIDYVMEICTVDGSQDTIPNDCAELDITE